MKEVSINGVAYLPASALAKQFRYTTDYIGQLCRAKKIDAQLIGRSWYVNPLSLTAHKQARYAKSGDENISKEESKVTISRVEVEPVLTKNNVKMSAQPESHFAKRIAWNPLKYESDEGDLLPDLKPSSHSQPRRVHVDLAGSTDIAIKTSTKITTLEPEPLPEVSLKGKLSVSSLDEAFDIEETDISPEDIPVPTTPVAVRAISTSPKPVIHHHALPAKSQEKPTRAENSLVVTKTAVKTVTKNSTPSPFTPASVQIESEDDVEGYQLIKISLVTTGTVLALCLLVLLFGESRIEATAISYNWGIDFSTESLAALVVHFSY